MGRRRTVESPGRVARQPEGRRSRHHLRKPGPQRGRPPPAYALDRASGRRLEVERHLRLDLATSDQVRNEWWGVLPHHFFLAAEFPPVRIRTRLRTTDGTVPREPPCREYGR